MSLKVYIKTSGCQMNEYDSAKILDILEATEGYSQTEAVEHADLIVLNTCSVREKAQEKLFSDLGRIRKLKPARAKIAVGGCVASQEGEGVLQRAPYVDVVFGPQTLHRLPALIEERQKTGRPQIDLSFPEIEKFDHLPEPKVNGPTAFVSIMEGCSKYCSFCVVPYTRGDEFSREVGSVMQEIEQLARQGVREVTLLGQNVNAYLASWGSWLPAEGESCNFSQLLHLVAQIKGIDRIRYTTSHPIEFSDQLIASYRTIAKLVNHVHLPVQHGSDKILMAMKRGYSVLEYKSRIRKLRQIRPNLSISSDFIVGFPGETEKDFQLLLNLVE
ncbi:MAG: tRNA (N6-isopentenyl adenosine(37)-C2)-methylthiotransferase MiaB, partial [Gammaproteobacteria bacterium]|nr:tRNA (N6-isopentenyl adenosine(37)-C2)-methylthiotransferase MiaB [Gammaproteobacteria bacterium]